MTQFTITYWPSLHDTQSPKPVSMSWEEVVAAFSTHAISTHKHLVGGFSPAIFGLHPGGCINRQVSRRGIHRCDASVESITVAVFDADEGDAEDIQTTRELLSKANIAQHWYTSFSWPEKESWRLMIPLANPEPAVAWKGLREHLIREFKIPAALDKCSGKSHFYYNPTRHPSRESRVFTAPGNFYVSLVPIPKQGRPVAARKMLMDWSPPPERDVDPQVIKEILKSKIKGSRFSTKNQRILAVLEGKPLAEQGSRNVAMNQVCGIVGWLGNYPLSVLFQVVEPSLRAMQAKGSKLTDYDVERMLLTAMRNYAEAKAFQEELDQAYDTLRERIQNTGRISQ